MEDKTLEEIMTMLNSYSFSFKLCDTRHAESIDGSTEYVGYCGVLRDAREFVFEQKRLKSILANMKKLGFYVTVHPEIRHVRQFQKHMSRVLPIGPDEVMVCFLQEGLIQTLEGTSVRVMESLKRNFLYFQEDEKVLEAAKMLKRMDVMFEDFRRLAYEWEKAENNSRELRTFIFAESKNMGCWERLNDYMEDAVHRIYAERLILVICCLEMVCRGE